MAAEVQNIRRETNATPGQRETCEGLELQGTAQIKRSWGKCKGKVQWEDAAAAAAADADADAAIATEMDATATTVRKGRRHRHRAVQCYSEGDRPRWGVDQG